jgi:DNA-binding transcriptional LysR family regulator
MVRDHALARKKLTLEAYASAEHLLIAPLSHRKGPFDALLASHGLSRHVRLAVPQFSVAGALVCEHDLMTLLPRRVAESLPERRNLVLRTPPWNMPPIDYFLFWHPRFDRDLSQKFLRDQIVRAVRKPPSA